MNGTDKLMEKWHAFCEKIQPGLEQTGKVMGKIGYVLKQIGVWIIRLRKVFMAIPVVVVAMRLAFYCQKHLPEMVGIIVKADGEFYQMISKSTAVYGCLGITACCLLLMFCSRRAMYPWLISIFSLIVPIFLLISNMFPA